MPIFEFRLLIEADDLGRSEAVETQGGGGCGNGLRLRATGGPESGLALVAGQPAGNTVWQAIYQTDLDEEFPVLCAVLCWSGAALRLKDRDDWIGWDPLTRGSRLPLVTQLRRFVVLESRREPNLATRCMGLGLRKLAGHFEEKYGYRPLLAESFSDPQHHEGTLYKASNWTPLGLSKGFKRHKSEFYTEAEEVA